MIRSRHEQTLARPCEISGRGYWSGDTVHLRCLPAAAGSGIRFVRIDLPEQPVCPATCRFTDAVSMRTNLVNGDAKLEMVEHLMAALYALQIDNCQIEIDGYELPGLDGSAAPYVAALQAAGVTPQLPQRTCYVIEQSLRIGDDQSWIEVSPVDDGQAVFAYHLDYGPDSAIPPQRYQARLSPAVFMNEISAARTFVTADQVARLKTAGVGQHVSNEDLLVFAADGSLVGNELRFVNECARHKTLDLIGDLALVGVELIGRFESYRGGHRLNGQLARQLADLLAAAATHPTTQPPVGTPEDPSVPCLSLLTFPSRHS